MYARVCLFKGDSYEGKKHRVRVLKHDVKRFHDGVSCDTVSDSCDDVFTDSLI